jgi:hypothetical protein
MTRLRRVFLGAVAAVVVGRCMSDSTPEQRFDQSSGVAPLVSSIPVSDPNNFTFAIVGDLHIGNQGVQRLQEILTGAAAENDSFVIFLGDIVEDGNLADVQAFRNTLSETGWDQKSEPVIGNHDIFNNGWQYYLQYNGPSHFTFTAGNSLFIVLDTASGTVGNEQTTWLQSQLQSSNLPTNTFLLSHYGPVVPTIQTYLKLANQQEAQNIMSMAVQSGVRAWFAAHYHSYLNGVVNGVNVVIAGGGGGKRMPPVEQFFFVQVSVSGTNVTYKMNTIQ